MADHLFAPIRTIEDFYLQLSMLAGSKMNKRENTLVFLDDIQKAFVLSNERIISHKGKIIYLPIYFVMFF